MFYYDQVNWKDTILDNVMRKRKIDIELLELLMSVVGVILAAPYIKNSAITIYNDNPGAAGAIRTKAPKLYRLDLQFLIRHLAFLAVKNKFYFWGLHFTVKDGKEMKIADDLSRFTFDISECKDNIPVIDCRKIVNNLLDGLNKHPLNLPKKFDVNINIRKQFGLLLNDKYANYDNSKIIDVLKLQKMYNILTN